MTRKRHRGITRLQSREKVNLMDLGGAVATGDSPFQPLQPFQWRPRFGRRSALGVAGALLGGRHGAHDLVDMLAAAAPGGLVAACAFNGVTHDFPPRVESYVEAVKSR